MTYEVALVSSHKTPASDYPRKRVDNYRISETRYTRGYYNMSGVGDLALYKVTKAITVTELQEKRPGKWNDWMVDDPPHWGVMQYYASQMQGRVLTAGLGLGLIHHCLAKNPAVQKIVAVERSPEVIELVRPYIPESIEVVQGDFYDFIEGDAGPWDWVFLDLWVGYKSIQDKLRTLGQEVFPLRHKVQGRFPGAGVAVHGFMSASDIRYPVSPETLKVLKLLFEVRDYGRS